MPTNTYSDSGIILRRFPIGENDFLLIIFTKYHGKLKAVARGVRNIRSRRGGHIDLFNKAVFQIRANSEWLSVEEANVSNAYEGIKGNNNMVKHAYHIAEILDMLLAEGDKQVVLYEKVSTLLDLMSVQFAGGEVTENVLSAIRTFEIDMLKVLGYWSDDVHGKEYPIVLKDRETYTINLIESIIDRKLNSYRTLA